MTMLEFSPLAKRDIESAHGDELIQHETEPNCEMDRERTAVKLGACAMADYQSILRGLSAEEGEKMKAEMLLIDSSHWRESVLRKYGVSTWQNSDPDTY